MPDNPTTSKREILRKLEEVKNMVTDTGHMYISLLKLPIRLDKMVEVLDPFVKLETQIQDLIESIQKKD